MRPVGRDWWAVCDTQGTPEAPWLDPHKAEAMVARDAVSDAELEAKVSAHTRAEVARRGTE